MKTSILVTGATGHLGNVLIKKLNDEGKRIRAMVFPGEDTTSLNDLDVERVEADILEPGALREAVAGMKYVYHLASLISIGGVSDELVRKVNIQGTRNVALACREGSVERLVYVSSIHALERSEEGRIIDEKLDFDPANPAGEYDRSKAEASLEVLRLVRTGLDAVIVCPTGIIGPFDFRRSEMGRMITKWMKKQPHGMVEGHFDFVDVRDVADGLISACRNGVKGETYILSGSRIRLADVRSIVQERAGIHSRQIMIPARLALAGTKMTYPVKKLIGRASGFTPYAIETVLGNSHISSARAESEIGYRSRPIEDSIADTVAWWQRHQCLTTHPEWYGKVALVTGASSGIGAATAKKLASQGLEVLLVARREHNLEQVVREIRESGGRADSLALDLTSDDAVTKIQEWIASRYHGVDILVNCAGIGWYGSFSDMAWNTADAMMSLNNKTLVRLSLFVLGLMKKRRVGRIINIGSIAGEIEAQGVALFSATKSFVNTLTRSISRELRGSNIKICVLRPGAIESGFFDVSEKLAHGRHIPGSRMRVAPDRVAESVWRLVRRPRVNSYVPGGLEILRFVGSLFGVLLDLVGPIHLKRVRN